VRRCRAIWLVGLACAIPCESLYGEWFSDSQPIMGTEVRVELWHEDPAAASDAVAAVLAEMHRIDALMSSYQQASEISAVNRGAAAGPVAVSAELVTLLERSADVSRMTGGAFDVTYASAGRFYDYREGVRPDQAQLSAAVEAIDYRYVQIDRQAGTVRFAHPQVYVDLGGIAKGYAVDRAADLLRGMVPNAIINAGGDLTAFGSRNPKHPWVIGLQHPREPSKVLASFALDQRGVATSGDYQKYFMRDGIRYHHILDPKTGLPARGLASVTVIAPNVMQADALATAVFVMGAEKGLAWINTLPEVEALVVLEDGKLQFSSGFRNQPQFSLR